LKYLFYIILAGIGIAGCRSAEELTHKAISKDAATVQDITRKLWPCITVATDTITHTDTLADIIAVDCPTETAWRTDTLEITEVQQHKGNTVYVRVPRIRETVRITTRIRDMIDKEEVTRVNAQIKSVKRSAKAGWITAGVSWLIIGLLVFILIKRR